MPKPKLKSIQAKEATIALNSDGVLELVGYHKENEVIIDLVKEINGFVGLTNLEFKLSEKKVKTDDPKEKKPTYKFECACGKTIKSDVENLNVQCNDCNKPFALV